MASNDTTTVATSEGQQNVTEGTAQEAENPHQPTKLESFFAITKSLIIRALIIYFITSFFRRPAATPQTTDPATGTNVARSPAWNIFSNGTVLDMYVYVSEDEEFASFDDPDNILWIQKNLIYGDWMGGPNGDGSLNRKKTIQISEGVRNNGSIYLHAYIVKSGKTPNPKDGKDVYGGKNVCYLRRMLNKYKKKKFLKTKNLLTGETEQSPEDVEKAKIMKEEIVSHWHPNLTLNLVTDQTNWVQGTVPPPLDEYILFTADGQKYKPVFFANDFWNMQRDYRPINKTTETVELYLTYQPLSLFKWQLYSAQSMRNKWTSNFVGEAFATEEEDEDQDTLKETLLETSPYLLGITIAVSILHSIFELLAFKNDIQFWNNRKSLEGLSVRSVFFNVFQSVIVLLYVLDNDTNTIIRISCFVGLAIEVWKIHKVIDFKLDRENKIFGLIPRISYQDKGSYVDSSTRQYDTMAFKYLSWVCFPLLGCYAVYSLLYLEHKGWYSFILNMLYGFLLTFGFIMMTPQLFINYKLKSVAHLPWRMMTYKFLNTFIDDIFAFVIKMPTMYRLGCFRDDIVFFVFLYQRWIYKVDASRVNEFGFSGEMIEEAEKQKGEKDSGKQPAIEDSDANKSNENKKND